VALLTIAPMWLLGRTTLPPNNIKELIAWLTVNGDRATVILGERATSTSFHPTPPGSASLLQVSTHSEEGHYGA
jgi:hypothetical protein